MMISDFIGPTVSVQPSGVDESVWHCQGCNCGGKIEHHKPNVLPLDHSRIDFDFDYKDGVWGPIRIGGISVPSIPINIPVHVWCKRHGWEEEVDTDELDH